MNIKHSFFLFTTILLGCCLSSCTTTPPVSTNSKQEAPNQSVVIFKANVTTDQEIFHQIGSASEDVKGNFTSLKGINATRLLSYMDAKKFHHYRFIYIDANGHKREFSPNPTLNTGIGFYLNGNTVADMEIRYFNNRTSNTIIPTVKVTAGVTTKKDLLNLLGQPDHMDSSWIPLGGNAGMTYDSKTFNLLYLEKDGTKFEYVVGPKIRHLQFNIDTNGVVTGIDTHSF